MAAAKKKRAPRPLRTSQSGAYSHSGGLCALARDAAGRSAHGDKLLSGGRMDADARVEVGLCGPHLHGNADGLCLAAEPGQRDSGVGAAAAEILVVGPRKMSK